MKLRFSTQITAMLACTVLAGCAGSGDKYPSLAIRDAERAQGQFTPAEPDPEPIRPVVSVDDIASLVGRAQEAHLEFKRAETGAVALAGLARGQGIESDARQRALLALADLTTLRSQTALPMGDLDLLKAKAATTFAPTIAIDEARAAILVLLAEQDGTLDALWSDLSR